MLFIAVPDTYKDISGNGSREPAARKALAMASPQIVVDAHDLAGGFQSPVRAGVDFGKRSNGKNGLLHSPMADLDLFRQPSSVRVAPSMILVASLASGTPVALLTTGRSARPRIHLQDIQIVVLMAYWTFIRP